MIKFQVEILKQLYFNAHTNYTLSCNFMLFSVDMKFISRHLSRRIHIYESKIIQSRIGSRIGVHIFAVNACSEDYHPWVLKISVLKKLLSKLLYKVLDICKCQICVFYSQISYSYVLVRNIVASIITQLHQFIVTTIKLFFLFKRPYAYILSNKQA